MRRMCASIWCESLRRCRFPGVAGAPRVSVPDDGHPLMVDTTACAWCVSRCWGLPVPAAPGWPSLDRSLRRRSRGFARRCRITRLLCASGTRPSGATAPRCPHLSPSAMSGVASKNVVCPAFRPLSGCATVDFRGCCVVSFGYVLWGPTPLPDRGAQGEGDKPAAPSG
jgi:hypothetical protein